MTSVQVRPVAPGEDLGDLTERGQAIYKKIKSELEPEFDDQYVVIHVDTEDYAVAPVFTVANRMMMTRRSADGRLFGRRIGSKPDDDFVARLAAFEVLADRAKWAKK